MTLEAEVAANYGGRPVLDRILGLVAAAGSDPERLTAETLKPFDSLHLGGWRSTEALLDSLRVKRGDVVLDIGCGIGGTARTLVATHGARVEGVDLSPEFVDAAAELTRRSGLAGAAYRVASALALPFPDRSFDLAVMLHVGMNIADKPALFAEAARVLRPDGRFGVYDVMRIAPGEVAYPVPWAGTEAISFIETPDAYARAAADAGFHEAARHQRTAEGIAFLEALQAAGPERGMPPDRLANILAALRTGTLAPVEMIFTLSTP